MSTAVPACPAQGCGSTDVDAAPLAIDCRSCGQTSAGLAVENYAEHCGWEAADRGPAADEWAAARARVGAATAALALGERGGVGFAVVEYSETPTPVGVYVGFETRADADQWGREHATEFPHGWDVLDAFPATPATAAICDEKEPVMPTYNLRVTRTVTTTTVQRGQIPVAAKDKAAGRAAVARHLGDPELLDARFEALDGPRVQEVVTYEFDLADATDADPDGG